MLKSMLKLTKKKKEEVDLKNEVDQELFQVDKTLKEVKGKVPEDDIKG